MSAVKTPPVHQAHFQELASLIEGIRSGALSGDQAIDAMHRVHDLMGWSADEEDVTVDVDYLIA